MKPRANIRYGLPSDEEVGKKVELDLGEVVDRIFNGGGPMVRQASCKPLPSRQAIVEIVEDLRAVVFPYCFGPENLDQGSLRFHLGSTIDKVHHALQEQLHRGLCFECDAQQNACDRCEVAADNRAARFISRLPHVTEMMARDVHATYLGDPASLSEKEVTFSYPGITATMCYRIAHELYHLNAPIISRIISEYAHNITGIDIHPGAEIGSDFMIDHGTGVVIGETTEIGNNVRIYQGVTLGAKSFPLDADGNPIKGIKRHPNIGDNVVIYSGATLLGDITVGEGSVIGGNVWLTESVPPGSTVVQQRATHAHFKDGAGI